MSTNPRPFPPDWASGFGEDHFGLWAELSVGSVVQRLRWIAPGTFLMGSPNRERGDDNERPQHKVTLTNGYWLADTACTQAFWLAVSRGDNPSHFDQDVRNPVERVSWYHINVRFLPLLQQLIGQDVSAQLPSEAEWEYACRAGTRTPFSFGEHISHEQVNYSDNIPDIDASTSTDRRRTVAVASLPANPWGLFEMHGNVLELCHDGRRTYSAEAVVDPEGPTGGDRVLRGGSWLDRAWRVRSARRGTCPKASRAPLNGFRFSLRTVPSPGFTGLEG